MKTLVSIALVFILNYKDKLSTSFMYALFTLGSMTNNNKHKPQHVFPPEAWHVFFVLKYFEQVYARLWTKTE